MYINTYKENIYIYIFVKVGEEAHWAGILSVQVHGPVLIDVKSQALPSMHGSPVLWVGRDSRIIGPNWSLVVLWAH